MHFNGAHWHLLVNHFPIIGSFIATLVSGYGLVRKSESVRQLGFGLFVLMTVMTLVTNQTGEQAEHYLRSINALDRDIFRQHEDAAGLANIGMYLTGLLSLLSLVWERARQYRFLPLFVFVMALVTCGLMANVGRLGGLVMHKELRDESAVVVPATR